MRIDSLDPLLKAQQARRWRLLRLILQAKAGDAAKVCGMTSTSYSNLEGGLYEIRAVVLARFCSHYGMPADYILTGSYKNLPDSIIRHVMAAEEELPPAEPMDNPAPSIRPPRGKGRVPKGKARKPKAEE